MTTMKRILFITALLYVCVCAYAQTGLNVAPYFSNQYTSRQEVTSVSLSGKKFSGKRVDVYRSISVTGNASLSDKITVAVTKDGVKAKSKEVSYKNGQLYFGFYQLTPEKGRQRYLLFLNRRPVGKEKTTVIYIEGRLDPADVKKMIEK